MICALMFIISKYYGIKCLNHLLQLEPCNVMLKVVSDLTAHWYDIAINFCIAIVPLYLK